jgi:hypothetical protein
MESRLVQRSLPDDAFRQMLLEDPGAAVEEERTPYKRCG